MPELADLKLKLSASGGPQVVGELNAVDRGINTVAADAHKGGGALRGMFSVGGGVALAGGIIGLLGQVKGAIGGIIGADAAMEQSTVILTQVTGSADKAKALIADVQKLAASTPFSFPELITATQNLEAFGLKSQDWLTVIGDTAAGTAKSVDQVTQAVLDAHTGQYERLKELGIDAKVEGDKLVLQYSKNGQTIRKEVDRTNQAVIDSTIQGIWNDKYQGMMEKQSHTFIGQWSTLKDNVSMLAQGMSGGVFGALRGMLAFANDVFAKGWSKAITDTFGDSAIGRALQGLGNLAGGIARFGRDLKEAFGTGTKVSDLIKGFPGWLQPAVEMLLTLADAAGDVARGFSADGLAGAFDALGPAIRQALGAIGSFAIDVVVDIASWVLGKLPSLADWLDGLFGGSGAVEDPMLVGMSGDTGIKHVTISQLAVDVLGWTVGEIADLWGWLQGLVGVQGGYGGNPEMAGLPGANKVTLSDVVVNVISWAKGALADVAAAVQGWIDAGGKRAATLAQWSLDVAAPKIGNVAGDVGGWVQRWLDGRGLITGTLKTWVLHLNDPNRVDGGNVQDATQKAVNKQSTIALLYAWYLNLKEPNVKHDPNDIANAVNKAVNNQSVVSFVQHGLWQVFLNAPIIKGIDNALVELNKGLNEIEPFRPAAVDWILKLNDVLTIDSAKFGGGPGGLSLWLAGEIAKKIGSISIPVPRWLIDLPAPTLGNLFTGSIALGLSVGQAIAKAIGSPRISIPDWSLDLGDSPTLPDWVTNNTLVQPFVDLANALDRAASALKTAYDFYQSVKDAISGDSNSGRTGDGNNIGGTGPTGGANSGGSGAGGELVQFLGGGFTAPKPDFSAFTGGLADLAKTSQDQTNAITDQFVQLRNNAQTLAESTNNAVTNAFVGMRNNVQSLMGSLVSVVAGSLGGLVGTAAGEGYAVGSALGQGLYAGMASWLSAIATGAAALVGAAVAAARAAADARSPSRKMMALGNDMVAGLLIPLHGGRAQVAGAMGNLVALPVASTAARATVRGGGGPVVQHVYQEGAFRGALVSADFERRMERVATDAADRRINSRRLGESR